MGRPAVQAGWRRRIGMVHEPSEARDRFVNRPESRQRASHRDAHRIDPLGSRRLFV
jgi:hypothetical protein